LLGGYEENIDTPAALLSLLIRNYFYFGGVVFEENYVETIICINI
jgi:hypothetical protein